MQRREVDRQAVTESRRKPPDTLHVHHEEVREVVEVQEVAHAAERLDRLQVEQEGPCYVTHALHIADARAVAGVGEKEIAQQSVVRSALVEEAQL